MPSRNSVLKSVYIFNHIPKCAGTSISNSLERAFGTNYHHIISIKYLNGFQNLNGISEHLCISGHYCTGVEKLFKGVPNIYVFTMLRHPFSIFLSSYRMLRHRLTINQSLGQYLCTYENNVLLRYMGSATVEDAKKKLKEAIESYNKKIEKDGLILKHSRMF